MFGGGFFCFVYSLFWVGRKDEKMIDVGARVGNWVFSGVFLFCNGWSVNF